MTDGHDDLRERLAALRVDHERQAARIGDLEAALRDETPAGDARSQGSVSSVSSAGSAVRDRPATTDRRRLLQAGAVAVGGLVAGSAVVLGESTPASAQTTDTGNPALLGTASPTTGTGVQGIAGSGTGVWGRTTDADGIGVRGEAVAGIGVQATGAVAPLRLGGNPGDPTGAALAHTEGELYYSDDSNSMWLCVADGTPGTWRKVGGKTTAGSLHVLPSPVRVYDSRPNFAPAIGPKSFLAAGTTRAIDLKGNGSGVPAGASAALVSLIVADTAAAGYLAIFRNGIPWPGTSNVNWNHTGDQMSVTTITALDAAATAAVYANVATDVIIDVLGFYR